MKTSFLPRPSRVIKPAPEPVREFTGASSDTPQKFTPTWDMEPERAFTSAYAPFPQAPDPNSMLSADLEPFRRTK